MSESTSYFLTQNKSYDGVLKNGYASVSGNLQIHMSSFFLLLNDRIITLMIGLISPLIHMFVNYLACLMMFRSRRDDEIL